MITYKCDGGFFIVSEKHKEVQLKEYNENIIKHSFNVDDKLAKTIFKAMEECLKKDK